jgi:RNA ligase
MKYDLKILNDYIERGMLERNPHPYLSIDIYNYTRDCQFTQSWDDITLNMRGTVLDLEGNVVARTFPKFFNMEEHTPDQIPSEPFDVFEKMDGSLGILFHYDSDWHLATRGSFVSDQAVKGKGILSKYKYQDLDPGCTYLFEIIYSENRIVVSYDYEDLVLLAIIDNQTGYEYDIHNVLFRDFEDAGFKIVKKYNGIDDYKELKKIIPDNSEGFVIKFVSGFRMKIKGEEYVRLHRLITNFSNVDIWEVLKEGKNLEDFLDKVPDEFDSWVKRTMNSILTNYQRIESQVGKIYEYHMFGKFGDKEPETDKKKYAEWVKERDPKIQPILFKMFDGGDYSKYLWRLVRPEYQKPFWNKED